MFTFATKEQARTIMKQMIICMPKIHHTIIPISGPTGMDSENHILANYELQQEAV